MRISLKILIHTCEEEQNLSDPLGYSPGWPKSKIYNKSTYLKMWKIWNQQPNVLSQASQKTTSRQSHS